MYGVNNNKISGNARFVETDPLIAINITALEEDLFFIKNEKGVIKFHLYHRHIKDMFHNDFILIVDNNSPKTFEANGAWVSSRRPKTIIDVAFKDSLITSPEFQKLKNKNRFLKFHLLELEYPDKYGNNFSIHAGHYNYVHKHMRVIQ